MKKIVKKNTEKVAFTPAYIIDLTKAETAEETLAQITIAKLSSVCTTPQIKGFIIRVIDVACDVAIENLLNDCVAKEAKVEVEFMTNPLPVKKPNIFTRFWNWITRKK